MIPIVFEPGYVVPLPEGHRFPMPKFGMLAELLRHEGIAAGFEPAEPATREVVRLVHTDDYIRALETGDLTRAQERRIGLPWSDALIRRTFLAVGGTIATARLALEHGIACNCAGGTHHAHPAFGSGFCLLNDLAITARLLTEEGSVSRILVVDLDVHQGDGTAAALAHRPEIFSFSMHCGSNFPFRKVPSDLDIALDDRTGDEEYLRVLASTLPDLIERVRPDLILYDAGVDVYAGDRLGRLILTREGIARRDHMVLTAASEREIPIAAVIGGGYDTDLAALTDRHATVHRIAATIGG